MASRRTPPQQPALRTPSGIRSALSMILIEVHLCMPRGHIVGILPVRLRLAQQTIGLHVEYSEIEEPRRKRQADGMGWIYVSGTPQEAMLKLQQIKDEWEQLLNR